MGKIDSGFTNADSDNLPKVDMAMVNDFYVDNMQFFNTEMRNVKAKNEKSPSSRVKMNVIANSAKFYVVFNNKEVSITNLIVTPELIVGSLCSDSKSTVLILTSQRKRDNNLIQSAVKRLKKIITLPSPSVDMECNKLV